MTQPIFSDPPTVELLQWLARGSLKQNLLRAVRFWVLLRLLYGDESERLDLSNSFSYSQWRDAFFSPTHPKGEEVPRHQDTQCLCHKKAADWLFAAKTGIQEAEWRCLMTQHAGIDAQTLDTWLQIPLFALTRRMLAGDLQTLTQLQWLKYNKPKYQRVQSFPKRPVTNYERSKERPLITYNFNFLPPDLALIAQNYSQQTDGIQRFFLHVDYVVPSELLDKVEDFQEQLRTLWAQIPVPPVLLVYKSAKHDRNIECIVYPVCIYYVQRATYLCALGHNPNQEVNWWNYRLDRLQSLAPLTWTDDRIPASLLQQYRDNTLPTPDYIQEQMAQAWGFDYYQTACVMLLRFDRIHDRRYIQGTVRHETFKSVSYQEAKRLIKKLTQPPEQKMLLEILARFPQDAYYTATYREGDPNVLQRLQAWRPFVEVLLPETLRQRVAADVEKEWRLYY
ncbi:MAG TPA: TIGR03985 family CRISPR-associated protein [Cyanobacteria bacterium UBA8803]|nr:TIGR03985 family CRISPR-associated protein [Cyanobacteria bacterium UBA9273]HBL62279.1 TIGR03985 family CRISPR-associated protein [Cyanobacteria bacterium UBA8803]